MEKSFKIIMFFLSFFFVSNEIYTQDTIKENKSIITFEKNDTLQHNVKLIYTNPKEETFLEKYFLGIAIFLIGIKTSIVTIFANIIITKITINSTFETKMNELRILNKHQWATDLRNAISNYLTEIFLFANKNSIKDSIQYIESLKKITFLHNNILLLLDSKKEKQQELINLFNQVTFSSENAVNDAINICFSIRELSKEILYEEWNELSIKRKKSWWKFNIYFSI